MRETHSALINRSIWRRTSGSGALCSNSGDAPALPAFGSTAAVVRPTGLPLHSKRVVGMPLLLLLAAIASFVALVQIGTVGSAAAACNGVPGDVNQDGEVNVVDAQCGILTTLWVLAGRVGEDVPPCLNGASPAVANANCDNSVNVVDVQLIVLFAFGAPLDVGIDGDGDGCPDACQDAISPTISITSPLQFTLFSAQAPITVTGEVQDDSAGVTVTVNGVAATVNGTTFIATDVPMSEGVNTLTAVAVDKVGNAGTASVVVSVDSTPPTISIETPPAGVVLGSVQVDVAGGVNDIIQGTTIQADDVTVVVNGIEAMVSNRAWVVPSLQLQPGPNTLTATATDAAGNSKTATLDVVVDTEAGQLISLVSGSVQTAGQGEQLPESLVVATTDANGDPIVGAKVMFHVVRGDGKLNAPPEEGQTVYVISNDDGLAAATFTLGKRAGAGNHRVQATAPGFVGFVEFCFAAEPAGPKRVTPEMGSGQTGVVGQPLPMPFIGLVTDKSGNAVEGVMVTFEVIDGGGSFDGATSITVPSSSDGQVSAIFTLGPDVGMANNLVHATFPGLMEPPGVFVASAKEAGPAQQTTISGVVLTNSDEPIPNATISVKGTPISVVTDDEGQFVIFDAPVGNVHLIADGATTTLPGVWPKLEYELNTVSGQDNTVGMPIYLPVLDMINAKFAGGDYDVKLYLENLPGTELTIYANSVTCPDGSKECLISWTQVNMERVPMAAPLGSAFMLATTVQPAGAHFDPPARICIPNMDMPVGEQMEIYSFDHDLEDWVAIGTATVQPGGQTICTDPGYGVVKAGWHGCVPPPPPKKCVGSCDDGNPCTSDSCKDGSCVHTPADGGGCADDGNTCTNDVCKGGSCTHPPKADGTACHAPLNECREGVCQGGSCGNYKDAPNGKACKDDGNECTGDQCKDGWCDHPDKPKGTPCKDDDNECTKDECDGGSCEHPPVPDDPAKKCGKDHPVCGPAHCKGGSCEFDNDAMEDQSCDPPGDGVFCTEPDKCKGGECKGEKIEYCKGVTGPLECPEVKFDLLGWLKLLLDPVQKASSITPCSLEVITSASGAGKGGATISGQKTFECCEAKQIKKAEKLKLSGSGSITAKLECLLVGIPVPKILQGILTMGVFLNLSAGGSLSLSWEKEECAGTNAACITGGLSASVGVTAKAEIFGGWLVGISGGGSAGAGASLKCCLGAPGELSGYFGKLEAFFTVTLFKFTSVNWKWVIWNGINSKMPINCF